MLLLCFRCCCCCCWPQGCPACEGGASVPSDTADPDQTFDPSTDTGIPEDVECALTDEQIAAACADMGSDEFVKTTCEFDVATTCDLTAADASMSVTNLKETGDTTVPPPVLPPVVSLPVISCRSSGDPHITNFKVRPSPS